MKDWITDSKGRPIAPPQPEHTPRPDGPWTQNGASRWAI